MKKTLIYLQSEEDDYYMEKIQKLANEKLALFALGKLGLSEECKQVNKLLKKPKGALKREHSSSMEEDHHEIENKNEKRKKNKRVGNEVEPVPIVVNEVTERLKEFIRNKMNGSDIKLVIQKKLFASDLQHNQNRLNMPFNQVETHDFLTPDEIEILNRHYKHDENCRAKLGIEVGLLGPTLRMYDQKIELKIWDMPKTHNYVLITNWYKFVMDHKDILKVGANIQVWSYRKNQQLCFAVACLDHKPKVKEILDGENVDVVAD